MVRLARSLRHSAVIPPTLLARNVMRTRCSIFWDNSNLFAGAREVARTLEGSTAVYNVRLHYNSLWDLARAGRDVSRAVCVGSTPAERQSIAAKLESTGLHVEMYDRGARTGGETAVDQALQVHMLRALVDEEPGVAVLLTGDGAGWGRGEGFFADLERMHRRGWSVELLAWKDSCNSFMRQWVEKHGLFVPLDDFYPNLTYLKGMRRQETLSHRRRNVVAPPVSREGREAAAWPQVESGSFPCSPTVPGAGRRAGATGDVAALRH